MMDPRSTSPGSNMPEYSFLKDGTVDFSSIGNKMHTLRAIGVPYSEEDLAGAEATAASQAQLIVDDLAKGSVELAANSELTALIAYLQRLGRGPQPTDRQAMETQPMEPELMEPQSMEPQSMEPQSLEAAPTEVSQLTQPAAATDGEEG